MKKYLLISHKFGDLKRGSFLISNRFVASYPEYLDYKLDLDAQNLEELNEQYRRLVFKTQSIRNYSIKMNMTRLRSLDHVITLRSEQNPSLYNSNSNGFHYYRGNKNFKSYVPIITNFPDIDKKISHEFPCIGFYARRALTSDSLLYIKNFLDNLKQKVDIYVLGEPTPEILRYPCISTYSHTYDQVEFFKNITHYIYPRSKIFQDPFPNSVLEAVQTGAQIILPSIPGRDHLDGIDDVADCIKWHKEFDPDVEYDNSGCILTEQTFKKFYLRLFENNFEYSFDRDKYDNFFDWVCGEVV